MTVEKKWVQVGCHQIYLEQYQGKNSPLVVLLHHGLGSVQAWQAQFNFLMGQGISVLVYDRWGYGRSDDRKKLDPPYFEEDVWDLEALLSSEKKPLVLVGHSDGGNIALSYARGHPDNLLGLIVVAAHIYFEPKMADGIQKLLRAYNENDAFRKGLQRLHEGKAVFERWFQAWAQLGVGWDIRITFPRILCPVLVIQGSDDEHATIQHAFDCAEALPKGRVKIVEGANHMLPQKSSEIFNQILFEALLDFQKVDKHVQ